jgi:hypothetical protein
MNLRLAFLIGLGVFALAAPGAFGQQAAMYKFVFKGTCYQKDASGNIVGTPITEQTLLNDRAQAGGADTNTLAIVYHLNGDPKGDTVEIVSAKDGSLQVFEFGFWFGSDPSLGRSALQNDSATEIRRVDQLFTLSDSTYTSSNSHGMGTVFITKRFIKDGSGKTHVTIEGPMQWIVNASGSSSTKICYGVFTASQPLF